MLIFNKIKRSLNFSNEKTRLRSANNSAIMHPFLLGFERVVNRQFGNYVFIPYDRELELSLATRGFHTLSESLVNEDSILRLGDLVIYNKKYNLVFIMIKPERWELLDASIDIAQSSTTQFTAQCHIVVSSIQILGGLGFEIKSAKT